MQSLSVREFLRGDRNDEFVNGVTTSIIDTEGYKALWRIRCLGAEGIG